MVRIGIVGLGGWAAEHWLALEEVQRSGACEIVATAVPDPQNHSARLEALAGLGVEVFGTGEEMVQGMRGRMDAVALPTPTETHADLMIRSVAAGYHVYVESPPAATVQEYDEMVAACQRAGRVCAVGCVPMWSQGVSHLKRRIVDGALGRVQSVTFSAGWIRKGDYFQAHPRAGRLREGDEWSLAGLVGRDMASWLAACLSLLSDEPRKLAVPIAVRAELYAARGLQADDTAAVEIITQAGSRCCLFGTRCADVGFEPEVTVLSNGGAGRFSAEGRLSLRYNDGRMEEPAIDVTRQRVEAFENFVSAAATGETSRLLCDLQMCRPMVLAINAAYDSARRVRPIPAEYLVRAAPGESGKIVVEGIDAALPEAASRGALFSDLDLPWAHRTATLEVTGYERFADRFVCDGGSSDSDGGLFANG